MAAFGAGSALAWQHPLWPFAATAGFVAWVLVALRWPEAWLVVVPLALPWLNFAPWTGAMLVEEFDLLLLGTLAAGFARRGWRVRLPHPPVARGLRFLALLSAGSLLVGLWRGVVDAGGASFGWFDGYVEAGNSLRVGKSLAFALAFWPLLRDALRIDPGRSMARFALGMQGGLMLVGLAVLWERAAYPGLLDFSTAYRTTALFWEMHVGGAAIDAYVALATPFAAWGVWSARTPRSFAVAGALAVLAAYTGLTTFSRGAYAGVILPLCALGVAAWLSRRGIDPQCARRRLLLGMAAAFLAALALVTGLVLRGAAGVAVALFVLVVLAVLLAQRGAVQLGGRSIRWRTGAAAALALALMTEAVLVVGGGTFMRSRMASSDNDFGSRGAHWGRGVALMHGTADGLVGIGLGRLPARYAREAPGGEFSGGHALVAIEGGARALWLAGPATDERLGSLYALTQRVSIGPGGEHRVVLRARADVQADLDVSVCEKHLLYASRCQGAYVRVAASGREWQRLEASLFGPSLGAGGRLVPPSGVFALAVADTGAVVELASVSLLARGGAEQLANRDFSLALAHWFVTARSYFVPWHIDNLALELLIERGVFGLACWVSMLGWAFAKLVSKAERGSRLAPFFAASLLGVTLVGMVSSVMDAPRIAFLMLLSMALTLATHADRPAT